MRPIEPSEILDLTSYEKIRPDFLAKMIEYKRARRISLGDHLTFIFENRETVIFQIQEMTRAERTVDQSKIEAEVHVYNSLIPGDNELSATLMIEIPDPKLVKSELDRLIGIDENIHLSIGEDLVKATFDDRQFETDRISAVQYVRFPLGEHLAKRFCGRSSSVDLLIEHPNYRARASIAGDVRDSLTRDLEK